MRGDPSAGVACLVLPPRRCLFRTHETTRMAHVMTEMLWRNALGIGYMTVTPS